MYPLALCFASIKLLELLATIISYTRDLCEPGFEWIFDFLIVSIFLISPWRALWELRIFGRKFAESPASRTRAQVVHVALIHGISPDNYIELLSISHCFYPHVFWCMKENEQFYCHVVLWNRALLASPIMRWTNHHLFLLSPFDYKATSQWLTSLHVHLGTRMKTDVCFVSSHGVQELS